MRTLNRLAAIVLALVLLAGGCLLVVETVLVVWGRPPLVIGRNAWYDVLRTTTVSDTIVLAGSIAIGVIGLLVLIAQLRPWRPVRMPAGEPGWYLRRRATQRSLASAIDRVPGVSRPKARIGRRWKVKVSAAGEGDDREAVAAAAREELTRLAAADVTRVRTRLWRRRVV